MCSHRFWHRARGSRCNPPPELEGPPRIFVVEIFQNSKTFNLLGFFENDSTRIFDPNPGETRCQNLYQQIILKLFQNVTAIFISSYIAASQHRFNRFNTKKFGSSKTKRIYFNWIEPNVKYFRRMHTEQASDNLLFGWILNWRYSRWWRQSLRCNYSFINEFYRWICLEICS